MIEETQDCIIAQLKTIPDVGTVDVWQGDIDELLKSPQRLPALYVIYQGSDFEEKKTIGGDQPGHAMDFLIVLVGKSLRSREAGAAACYAIIEAVRRKLIGLQILDADILWPVKEDLLLAEGGLLVYGLNYRMNNVLWEGGS